MRVAPVTELENRAASDRSRLFGWSQIYIDSVPSGVWLMTEMTATVQIATLCEAP